MIVLTAGIGRVGSVRRILSLSRFGFVTGAGRLCGICYTAVRVRPLRHTRIADGERQQAQRQRIGETKTKWEYSSVVECLDKNR